MAAITTYLSLTYSGEAIRRASSDNSNDYDPAGKPAEKTAAADLEEREEAELEKRRG